MRNSWIRVGWGVLLALTAANAGRQKPVTDIESRINSMVNPIVSQGSPGLAILVLRNGKMIFRRGYGIRDLRSKAAIDARTNFRLASCTKQFTAMAVMLLVHDGKLHYEDRLTDVFPEFPAYGKSITIRHLLNHTSGIPDYESLMDRHPEKHWSAAHQIQDGEVLKLLEAEQAGDFQPGTKWSYSNSGYVVLGLVVAKISGESFPDFLRERIFRPLKMSGTLAFARGENKVSRRAFGHSKEHGRMVETDQSSTSATLGDGGVYSNVEDLAQWDAALEHHELLSAEEMRPALEPVKLSDGSLPHWGSGPGDSNPQPGKAVAYGFGWFLDPYKDQPRMWHYGNTVGFQSAIERFTAEKVTVMVLANRADVDAPGLALKVAELFLR